MQKKNKTNNLQNSKNQQAIQKQIKKIHEPKQSSNKITPITSKKIAYNPERLLKAIKDEKKDRYYFGIEDSFIRQRRNSGSKESSQLSSNPSKSNLLRVKTQQHSLTCFQSSKDFQINLNYKRRCDKTSMLFTKKRQTQSQVLQLSKMRSLQNEKAKNKQIIQRQSQNEMISKLNDRINSLLSETEKLGSKVGNELCNQNDQNHAENAQMMNLQKTLNLLQMRISHFCRSAAKINESGSNKDSDKQQSQLLENAQEESHQAKHIEKFILDDKEQ